MTKRENLFREYDNLCAEAQRSLDAHMAKCASREPWEGRPSRFTGDMIPCEVPFPEEEDLEEEIEEEEEEQEDD